MEIQTFAVDNILIKLSAVTNGNSLNQSVRIIEPPMSGLGTQSAGGNTNGNGGSSLSIGITDQVSIIVGRGVIEAEYSADSNTTKFTFILSPSQYIIRQVGAFPNDKWDITIHLQTDFNVTFDQHPKFCLTPSPNYYGNYTTVPISGNQDYAVNLELSHPRSFAGFVDKIFLVPIYLLGILGVVCILITVVVAIVKRDILDKFFGSFVAVCSAIIVFIPVFQLSTQELKTPLEFTSFDTYFLLLLTLYVLFLMGLLIAKSFLTKGLNQEKPTTVRIDHVPTQSGNAATKIDVSSEGSILALFGHISRVYNSTINAMIAVIFGWLAFNGISLGLIVNGQFSAFKFVLAVIGIFIILIGCYLYIRALQFGRYLATMVKDLNLGNYLEKGLPRLLLVTGLNQRLIMEPNEWTWGEAISLILMILFFTVPSVFLFLIH